MALGLEQGVAEFIVSQGLGTIYSDPNGDVFIGEEPSSNDGVAPKDIVVVIPFGGAIQQEVSEDHLMEVRVRSSSYEVGAERMRNIHNALNYYSGALGSFRAARVVSAAPAVTEGRTSAVGFGDAEEGGLHRFIEVFNILLKSNFAYQ